ncbi:MAG: hypothetical protein LQ352_005886 [Teloschistes flavicans]|nr:MAG: hypothetical protein LQ352_005886 [Teloschistes flavicans]
MTPNGRSFKLGTSGLAEATYTEYKAEHPINADQRPEQQLYHQTLVDEDDRSSLIYWISDDEPSTRMLSLRNSLQRRYDAFVDEADRQAQLNEATERQYQDWPKSSYTDVNVLLLRWAEDNIGVITDRSQEA